MEQEKDMRSDFELAARAQALLSSLVFMNLATCSADAKPLNSPVFYAFDGDYFYWLSTPDAQHSRNIRENANVSIVVFDSTKSDWDAFGVYFNAKAEQISEDDIPAIDRAHKESCARAGKEPGDPHRFTGDFPRKYFRAAPEKVWINGTEERDGVVVDIRREIPLHLLGRKP